MPGQILCTELYHNDFGTFMYIEGLKYSLLNSIFYFETGYFITVFQQLIIFITYQIFVDLFVFG